MITATSGRDDAATAGRADAETRGRGDGGTRGGGDRETRGRGEAGTGLFLPFVFVVIMSLQMFSSGSRFAVVFLKSPFLRVSASRVPASPRPPRLRVPASACPRVSASRVALRSLIEREASFTIKVVKVLRLDEIETGTRHALKQRHDLIVRD